MKYFQQLLVLLLLLNLSFFGLTQQFRIPAEWEKQDKIWLTWFGQERRDSVSCRVIEALQPHIKIAINVEADSMKIAAQKYMAKFTIDTSSIEFVIDPQTDFFIRDYIFFVKDKNDRLRIACFDYSSWWNSLYDA